MKTLIHLSVQLSNYPGGLFEVWSSGSLMKIIIASAENSLRRSFLIFSDLHPNETFSSFATQRKVLYTPFPVCFRSSSDTNHSLVTSTLLYYFLFPLADDRLWHFILCRLEHLHLGFFLLGSINNIWFTYKILNDMFDIVLAVQQDQGEAGGDDDRGMAAVAQQQDNNMIGDEEDEEDGNQGHDMMQAAVAVAAAAQNHQRIDNLTRRLGKLVKGFLLTYCCSLVVLFWIHFNLFAFRTDVRGQDDTAVANNSEEEIYSSRQFVAEFPLWTFRWVTLGIAVGDFATRGIYGWLARITNCVDDEEVISQAIV